MMISKLPRVRAGWLLPAVVCCLLARQAHGAEKLIHGFEKPKTFTAAGKVVLVRGADAVTEGTYALQLAPNAAVSVPIGPSSIGKAGWLRIDTFQVQPALGSLQLSFAKSLTVTAHVAPGKDTIALPLGLMARTNQGAWPGQKTSLQVKNTSTHPVVVDNLRLDTPRAGPPESVLLDLGPAGQALWPGFSPGTSAGRAFSWSGDHRTYSFSAPYPDPLGGDFSGLHPSSRAVETITIRSPQDTGVAWVWLTHYGDSFSPTMECAARINGRVVLRHRLSPPQMLSPLGLLEGKGQPWTTDWFERTFVPMRSAMIECSLKKGANVLELASCQVAAVAVAPRSGQRAMQAYIKQLDEDRRRYRRQFVLATKSEPRCTVVPDEQESKAGAMLFLPPEDECFNRSYVPSAKHRAKTLKLTVAAGSAISAAVVAVPLGDVPAMQAAIDAPRLPGKGVIPAGGCQVHALTTMPVVQNARVHYQPFLPARSHRQAQARGVYWFLLRLSAPERNRPGTYKSTLRVTAGAASAKLPVEVEVIDIGPGGRAAKPTFAFLRNGDCADVYRSLKQALPPRRQTLVSKDIRSQLHAVGLNAYLIRGPRLGGGLDPNGDEMIEDLRSLTQPKQPGKMLVDMTAALQSLRSRPAVRPGTNRYTTALRKLVELADDLAAKRGLGDYALYCGSHQDLDEGTRLAGAIRAAGGRPAISTYVSSLAGRTAAQRAELFGKLDALLCSPNAKGLLGIRDELKKVSPAKALLVRVSPPDVYGPGFYCWAVGADGACAPAIFSQRPLFNAFWFDGRSMLVPDAKGGFEPTLGLMMRRQAMADYALAGRCERLAEAARKRKLDAGALEKVLTTIRTTADARPPGFDLGRFRPAAVGPGTLRDWRTALTREAGKLAEQMDRPSR